NYWADWTNPDGDGNGIVDHPYPIDGEAGNVDSYPQIAPYNPGIVEIPSPPRLLTSTPQGIIYTFIVFLSIGLISVTISFVCLKVLPSKLVQRIQPPDLSSSGSVSLEASHKVPLMRTALSLNLVSGIIWYILAAEISLFLIVITSSTLLTGSFLNDLVGLALQALVYPFLHPVTMLTLFSALAISQNIISLGKILLGVILALVHILTAIVMLIIRNKVSQSLIAEMVVPDKEKVRERLEDINPTKERLFAYIKEVKDLLKINDEEDE
ncbi:MAG: hypothetical protein ACFFBD_04015, partial [Candidatus Hodarchaeota archaeon]